MYLIKIGCLFNHKIADILVVGKSTLMLIFIFKLLGVNTRWILLSYYYYLLEEKIKTVKTKQEQLIIKKNKKMRIVWSKFFLVISEFKA
jgi:hypothetical protein